MDRKVKDRMTPGKRKEMVEDRLRERVVSDRVVCEGVVWDKLVCVCVEHLNRCKTSIGVLS